MAPAIEFPLSSITIIFDLNFIGKIVPLKRLSTNDLCLKSVPSSLAVRNVTLLMLLLFTVQKISLFVHRTVDMEISGPQIFHSCILPHVLSGLVCTAALAIKFSELKDYYNSLHVLNQIIPDGNGNMIKPWWCDKGSQILLYGCVVGYMVLLVAYAGAHIASPQDPLFFYTFASKYVDGWTVLILCIAFEFTCLLRLIISVLLTVLTGMSYVLSMNSLLRIRRRQSRRSADLIRRIKNFMLMRLVSDAGNSFWQYSTAMVVTPFTFFNLTASMTAMVIGATTLPVYVYVFLPLTMLLTLLILLYFALLLGSVREQSKSYIAETYKALPTVRDADRRTVQYMKKLIRAARPFGFQMGSFSFISVETAQDVLTESISNSLMLISLANVA